ncbi:unnamed protein product [Pylaiella littoralis]
MASPQQLGGPSGTEGGERSNSPAAEAATAVAAATTGGSGRTCRTSRSPKKKSKPGMNRGRWNQEEHRAFLKGLEIHGTTCWSAHSKLIMTRTPVQTRTHYKKYDHLRRKARSFPEEI